MKQINNRQKPVVRSREGVEKYLLQKEKARLIRKPGLRKKGQQRYGGGFRPSA